MSNTITIPDPNKKAMADDEETICNLLSNLSYFMLKIYFLHCTCWLNKRPTLVGIDSRKFESTKTISVLRVDMHTIYFHYIAINKYDGITLWWKSWVLWAPPGLSIVRNR